MITHENAPALAEGPMTPLGPSPPFPLRDSRVLHRGQHVAMVVASCCPPACAGRIGGSGCSGWRNDAQDHGVTGRSSR